MRKPINKRKHKINEEIRSEEVRLIGVGEPKIIKTYIAIRMAQEEGKDLILINENQDTPIVKIEDYNKFLYHIEKTERERKKNSSKSELKEIQLSVNISDHDLSIKAKKAKEFLNDGDKVKVVLSLKGRERSSPERAEYVILKFAESVEEIGIPESMPKLEGSKWLMILKQRKK
jgi:translation initiation factor IF-3